MYQAHSLTDVRMAYMFGLGFLRWGCPSPCHSRKKHCIVMVSDLLKHVEQGDVQDRAHEPECTSLCPIIFRENILRYKPMGLAIKPTALTMFFFYKLNFACSTCCYKATIFNVEQNTCASRARLVLQSCDFPGGAGTSRTRLALHSCDCPARAENLHFAY